MLIRLSSCCTWCVYMCPSMFINLNERVCIHTDSVCEHVRVRAYVCASVCQYLCEFV